MIVLIGAKPQMIVAARVTNARHRVFHYDGMGNRVKKMEMPMDGFGNVDAANLWNITYYIRDAQGNILTTLARSVTPLPANEAYDELHIKETMLYGSDRLGVRSWEPNENSNPRSLIAKRRFTHTGLSDSFLLENPSYNAAVDTGNADGSYSRLVAGSKSYELKNHLGNVLATVSDKRMPIDDSGDIAYYQPRTLNMSFYYPFGSLMTGLSSFSGEHRFGFNGQEKDDEVKGNGNHIDFGARGYDPRIGRWLSVDPLWKEYPAQTDYGFALNNPVMFVDKDGQEVFAYTAESKKLVLTTMEYLFGKSNGFSFDGNKLIQNGTPPSGMGKGQTLLFKYFTETILKSTTPVNVRAGGRHVAVDNPDGSSELLLVTPGGGVTLGISGWKARKDNGPGTVPSIIPGKGEEKRNEILISPEMMKNGINLETTGGDKVMSKEHGLSHEFAHAVMNIIMDEMGGNFNGVDFNAMSETERSDWAIQFTNTLLNDMKQDLETGAGQHGRSHGDSSTDVKPLEK